MKKSIRIASFLLSFIIFISLFIPSDSYAQVWSDGTAGSESLSALSSLKEIHVPEYEFLPASQKWMDYVADQKPAEFENIQYSYTDKVVVLNQNVTDKIASAGQLILGKSEQKFNPRKIIEQGGYIPITLLDSAASEKGKSIQPGSIVVDENTATAFKVVAPVTDCPINSYFKGNYSIAQPELHEIISDFTLTDQTIALTRGNISGFAKNVEGSFIKPDALPISPMGNDTNTGFKYISKNPMINFSFKDVALEGHTPSGGMVEVKLSGGLGIDGIDLSAKYSGFGGYKIGMVVKQECYLAVTLKAELNEELWIPLLGIDVNLGIGRITGGLFIIVNLDGSLRLYIEAREYTDNFIGIAGKTAFYVPITFRPAYELRKIKMDGDVSIDAKLSGAIRGGAKMGIEIFGLELVGAGAFIGAGLNTIIEGKNLEITVFGIVEAYVALLGKHFNLINYRPTIVEKKQRNTAGLKITIKEAFIKPGLVGGIMEVQTDDENDADGYAPAPGIEYRVKVVPEGVNPDADSPQIRYYASNTADGSADYDFTNTEGTFYQKDLVCKKTDTVYIEFKKDGGIYECDGVSPWLPFKRITLTQADYFSEFATGQVEPVKTIWWEAPIGTAADQRSQMTYYENGIVGISLDTGGMARTQTDEFGFFNTQNPLKIKSTAKGALGGTYMIIPNLIDIRPNTKFTCTIDINGEALLSVGCYVEPKANLEIIRVIEPVSGTSHKYTEGDTTIHSKQFDEHIWIVNHNGTRTVSSENISFQAYGYSTEDLFTKSYLVYAMNIYEGKMILQYKKNEDGADGLVPEGIPEPIVTAELDENGNQTGTALMSTRYTLEWVWQPHSNPVTITSPDHAVFSQKGGNFTVEAKGKSPLVFSLKDGVPEGVAIDKSSGVMTVPAGLPEGNYVFTVVAKESEPPIAVNPLLIFDEYREDTSPPDEQVFTLIIDNSADAQVPTETSTPSETTGTESETSVMPTTAAPTSTAKPTTVGPTTYAPTTTQKPPTTPQTSTADGTSSSNTTASPATTQVAVPIIANASHGYEFTKLVGGGDLSVPINASGGGIIIFSVYGVSSDYLLPREVSINPYTGILTIEEGISEGTYEFGIKAENAAGYDTQTCKATVVKPIIPTSARRTAPVISDEAHNYQFTKTYGSGDLVIDVNAEGSTPITFSLFASNFRETVPEEVTINPTTGEITVKDSLAIGQYFFTIKAENDIGSDTQFCRLDVVRSIIPRGDSGEYIYVATATQGSAVNPTNIIISPALTGKIPENSVTIRNDHKTDLYSKKQDTVNGADYIRWESVIWLSVEGKVQPIPVLEDVPLNDHHLTPIDTSKVEDYVNEKYKEQLSGYQKGQLPSLGGDSLQEMLENGTGFEINQLDSEFSFLDYGPMLESINSTPGGSFNVELGGGFVTVVTGKYFESLKGNKNGSLNFNQTGAKVTFMGKDINNSNDLDLFNFAYSTAAPHNAEIMAAVESGQKAFTYSFAHHGDLPERLSLKLAQILPKAQR